jgi:oxygen-dependent protoporphyrinogen oxidase
MINPVARRTIVIGGGITGLATAYYMRLNSRREDICILLESSSRVGGKIVTTSDNGFLIEGGPDSFLAQKASTQALCAALGITGQIVGSNSTQKPSTYIYSGGQMHPMPDGMMLMAPTMILPILRSKLLTWSAKLRLGLELFIPARTDGADESLASFVRRRLGPQMLDKIAAPLMAGIHAADPERLSLRSTFPIFPQMEHSHGSLALAMFHRKRLTHQAKSQTPLAATPQPKPMFVSLAGGLQQLTEALAAQLPAGDVRCNSRVRSVTMDEYGRYHVLLDDGSSLAADHIVFATPAFVTAGILENLAPHLAEKLRAIRYVSTATVSLAFRRDELTCPMQGLGFLVPASEKRRINACTWSSTKFSHRAPDDCVLLRVFIGGALNEQLAEQDERSLIELVRQELSDILGITAEPVLAKAFRWRKANPQYEVGHQQLLAEIEHLVAAFPELHLAGAAFHGAGIPDCVQQAHDTADRILQSDARALYHSHESFTAASA